MTEPRDPAAREPVTVERLEALACVRVPEALTERVMARVTRERRLRPLRLALAGASFAVWALAVHQAVQLAAERLQGLT